MQAARALLDAVPCDVEALHGFDIAASVGVGALGDFLVGRADFLEGSLPNKPRSYLPKRISALFVVWHHSAQGCPEVGAVVGVD